MTEVDGGGLVLIPGEARQIEMGAVGVRVLATGDETHDSFALLETAETIPNLGPPLHIHRDAAESFYVLEGEYVMHLNGKDFRCPAGSFIYVPRGMPHTFRSSVGSRKLNLFTPPAMVGYFDDLAAAIRSGVDEKGMTEIAERYSMEVLGPAPEGYL
jgi:mannose-6-phosphate isomerase-like protein (cupin superfamily)